MGQRWRWNDGLGHGIFSKGGCRSRGYGSSEALGRITNDGLAYIMIWVGVYAGGT